MTVSLAPTVLVAASLTDQAAENLTALVVAFLMEKVVDFPTDRTAANHMVLVVGNRMVQAEVYPQTETEAEDSIRTRCVPLISGEGP
ncbi:MAG: hypothetical protein COA37_07965 [Hoeflea sp.]|nr:MAG: hypothetical protein COA37_07965 [Hoeflea sp.]